MELIKQVDSEIKEIQKESLRKNMGFAFISFKEKDHVQETLEEIELVRQNLMSKKTIALGIADWKVQQAYPPSDIIWSEIQNISEKDLSYRSYLLQFLNLVTSILAVMTILFFDDLILKHNTAALLVAQYFCPLLLAFFNLYLNP